MRGATSIPRGLAWPVLLLSAVLEAVWANALSASNGFTDLAPTLVFLVATVASVVGLSFAMQHIPTGTAYAVWTSVGTVLTVGYSVATGAEAMSWLKALFLVGIVGCVIGLKQLDGGADAEAGSEEPAEVDALA
ncbi:DMT family transporter [Tessaracoccus defluvii]|uniref:DMT family transporter n=1 Tax=Tessaracoccus defluvii TaxID=1285901 RepID=UPI001D038D75|nr:multidrug efflux SMR transporter [Tessaracoccus defluvii]